MPHELLIAARASLAAGHRLAARTLLSALVRAEPGNGEAWHVLALSVDDPDQRIDCETRARWAGYHLDHAPVGSTTSSTRAHTLKNYVQSQAGFVLVEDVSEPYDHMGATITDAILQAGLNYATVVQPRVERLRREYPTCRTTTGFLNALEEQGPATLIRWTHPEKSGRIMGLARFLQVEGIETESQLATWLETPGNPSRLKQLRGIGDKTADYLRILVGLQASAVDRHLLAFLQQAHVDVHGYADAQAVINATADLLGVDHRRFDFSIWTYMSTKATPSVIESVEQHVSQDKETIHGNVYSPDSPRSRASKS